MQLPRKYGLSLVPPSPVSHLTPIEMRGGLRNPSDAPQVVRVGFYLDAIEEESCLHKAEVNIEAGSTATVRFTWKPTAADAGQHVVIFAVEDADGQDSISRPLLVIESEHRSLDIVAGAFSGFCHWSEEEGRLWNDELRTFTEDDWRSLVRAQYELGMNIMVPQETFRYQMYVGEHSIEENGYHGAACYESALYPGRMNIATADPLGVTFEEADRLGMQVFMPVGMYAWFDFTAGSLEWHKQVATELWSRYGHHDSFYGWYVSEEIAGDLGTDDRRREELVHFFQEFAAHCRTLAPEKPVMLATNCHYVKTGLEYYPRLLAHLDIICPFGFQRMPEDDISADEAAQLLQELCDAAGAHLWLDMEIFNFHDDRALYPRPIAELVGELGKRTYFEKIICYQFPGMFNPDWAVKKPGGPDTVRLYNEYKKYVEQTLPVILPGDITPAHMDAVTVAGETHDK